MPKTPPPPARKFSRFTGECMSCGNNVKDKQVCPDCGVIFRADGTCVPGRTYKAKQAEKSNKENKENAEKKPTPTPQKTTKTGKSFLDKTPSEFLRDFLGESD